MKELVEFIVKSLVSKPELLVITSEEEGDFIKISIKADEEDVGKIIGKQGKIAKSIRTIARSVAMKSGKKVAVEIN
ncbi:hypothetical protein HMPREF3188_00342 [Tissierellia bacterium KA00581]|jgi:hypothetical protein|nr:hypothetical protein HMPREF3188_00342 [Tissierellia bacterium KA00581]